MIVWGLSEYQITEAAEATSVKLYGLRSDGRGLRFTLKLTPRNLATGLIKWQRTSASYFEAMKDNPRKVAAVCWHGHYHFMRELFRLNPEARVKTAFADYRGLESFLDLAIETGYRNIGSMAYPVQMREACICAESGDDYIPDER